MLNCFCGKKHDSATRCDQKADSTSEIIDLGCKNTTVQQNASTFLQKCRQCSRTHFFLLTKRDSTRKCVDFLTKNCGTTEIIDLGRTSTTVQLNVSIFLQKCRRYNGNNFFLSGKHDSTTKCVDFVAKMPAVQQKSSFSSGKARQCTEMYPFSRGNHSALNGNARQFNEMCRFSCNNGNSTTEIISF